MKYFLISLILLSSCGRKNESEVTELVVGNYFAGEGESKHRRSTPSLYGRKEIVLTYDDHAGANTGNLLNLLRDEGVKATFFYNTKTFNPKSAVIKRLIQEGHILASHQHTHLSAAKYSSRSSFESELTRSVRIIEQAYDYANVENEGIYFRYPYGAVARRFSSYKSIQRVGQRLYSENCINYAFWDIDTIDWALKDSNKIFENVKNHLEGGRIYVWKNGRARSQTKRRGFGGGIVLMHDKGRSYAVEATRKIIRWGKRAGYRFVSLNSVDGYRFNNKNCRYRP